MYSQKLAGLVSIVYNITRKSSHYCTTSSVWRKRLIMEQFKF